MKGIVVILVMILVALHAIGSHRLHVTQNEVLLTEAIQSELDGDPRYSGVQVNFDHLDGTLSGTVQDETAKENLLAVARQGRLAGRLKSGVDVRPERDQPASLAVARTGQGIRLSGVVGSAEFKESLAQAAADLGYGEVDAEQLRVSDRVISPPWSDAVGAFTRDFFEQSDGGSLALWGERLALRGKIRSAQARDALVGQARTLLPGEGQVIDEMEWLPNQDAKVLAAGIGDRIQLTGSVPTEALRNALGLARPDGIDNQLKVDPLVLEPVWAGKLAPFLAAYFDGGSNGRVEVNGKEVILRGDRPASRGKQAALDAARPLTEAGCQVQDQIRLVADLFPTLRAEAKGGNLVLEGDVSSEADRSRIEAEAGKGGYQSVENRIRVNPAVQAPAWLNQLPALWGRLFRGGKPARLTLEAQRLEVARTLPSAQEKTELIGAAEKLLATLPRGATLETAALKVVVPLPAAVRIDLKEGTARLTGVVESPVRKEALGKALASLEGVTVENQLKVNPAVMEPEWNGGVGAFLQEFLEGAGQAEFELVSRSLRLNRSVADKSAKESLLAKANAILPKGATLIDELRVNAPVMPTLPAATTPGTMTAPKLPAMPTLPKAPAIPSTLRAAMTGDGVRLEGTVPDEQSGREITAALEAAKLKVDNRLKVDPAVQAPAWRASFPAFLGAFFKDTRDGVVRIDNRSLRLEGKVSKPETRSALVDTVRTVLPPKASLDAGALVVEVVTPALELAFTRSDKRFRLEGQIPDGDLGVGLETALRMAEPDVMIENRLKVEPKVEQPAWSSGLSGLLEAYARQVVAPELRIGRDEIVLGGKVGSEPARVEIAALARRTFGAKARITDQLQVAPMKPDRDPGFVVAFLPGGTELDGEVGDAAARQALVDGVTKAVGAGKFSDGIQVNPRVSKASWPRIVGDFIPTFHKKVRNGMIEIRDGKVKISGETADPATRDSLLAALAGALSNQVQIEDRMVARDQSDSAVSQPTFTVYFKTGSTYLGKVSLEEIQRSADLVNKVKADGATVLIKGFADSRGDAQANQILSEKRARAVRDELLSRGAPASQLEFIGVGESEAGRGRGEAVWGKDRKVAIIVVGNESAN